MVTNTQENSLRSTRIAHTVSGKIAIFSINF